ncbi:hypothetical protein BSKO_12351 [Bryopsis sp. KO-2023]|nr:hypothetical protein BSKO_12351 [Bryopsis sp. KO-2023]
MPEYARHRHWQYRRNWTADFAKQADVQLVVEGRSLPAHSQFLCQSEVFAGAILDTSKPTDGPVKIESIFEGVSLADADLVLAHVYVNASSVIPEKTEDCSRVIDLSMRFGFGAIVQRVLDTLTDEEEPEHFNRLNDELDNLDPGTAEKWFTIAYRTDHQLLKTLMSNFVARNFSALFGAESDGARWEEFRTMVKDNVGFWRDFALSLGERLSEDRHVSQNMRVIFHCPTCEKSMVRGSLGDLHGDFSCGSRVIPSLTAIERHFGEECEMCGKTVDGSYNYKLEGWVMLQSTEQ